MKTINDFNKFMNEKGYEVSEVETDTLRGRNFQTFKLGEFIFDFEDRLLNIRSYFCQYFGQDSPEVDMDEFGLMISLMQSWYKIGRVTASDKPLFVMLDWTSPMINKDDYQRAQLIFEYLIEIKENWKQTVFDVVHNNASFEDLFMEMEI